MISSADILHGKILIVDDQAANVALLEQMLRGAGYVSIASTQDPHEVAELHRQNHYDLILLDLQMPGMDGFQVMENLKEIETGRLSAGPRADGPAGSQAARAESRGEGFRQQTIRPRRGVAPGSQHARSPPAASANDETLRSGRGGAKEVVRADRPSRRDGGRRKGGAPLHAVVPQPAAPLPLAADQLAHVLAPPPPWWASFTKPSTGC